MSDTWQLGIESSAPRASLALVRNGSLVAERVVEASRNHSTVLGAPLAEVLAELPEREALAEVVIATGPGSYNGARVGIAAGQGVALVHGCAAVGLPSLEAVPQVREGGSGLALGDARRGSFFVLALEGGRVRGEPELLEHEAFLRRAETAREEGAWLCSLEDPARLRLPGALEREVRWATPEARLVLAAWDSRSSVERDRLRETPPQPFYLRPPHITEPRKR